MNTEKPSAHDGATLIALERSRQIAVEGYTHQHDDEHCDGELAHAAAAYAVDATGYESHPGAILNGMGPSKPLWPWGKEWWKPSDDPIRTLVKAGAFIAAEIDRLQRARNRAGEDGDWVVDRAAIRAAKDQTINPSNSATASRESQG